MVLIEVQGLRTVALGILLSFCLDLTLVVQYFRLRSVLPKLQASSGRTGEAVRATQRQQIWRENTCHTFRRSDENLQHQCEFFADFFMFSAFRLFASTNRRRNSFRRFFFMFSAFRLFASTNRRRNSIGAAQGKQKNRQSAEKYSQRFTYCYRNRLIILLY